MLFRRLEQLYPFKREVQKRGTVSTGKSPIVAGRRRKKDGRRRGKEGGFKGGES